MEARAGKGGKAEVEHKELIAEGIKDPGAAFLAAVEADDAVRIALVSIVDPRNEAVASVDRFEALVLHHGATLTVAELVLGVLEHAGSLSVELAEAAEGLVEERRSELPLDDDQAKRVEALICDRQVGERRRRRLLLWLWFAKRKVVRRAATARLTDPEEPYNAVSRQAIVLLGTYSGAQSRALLSAYAERQLEQPSPDPSQLQPNAEAALDVLNALYQPSDADVDLIARILAKAADRNLDVGNRLDKLFSRVTVKQIRCVVQHSEMKGKTAWLAGKFVPALINTRAAEIAATAGEQWWPQECLAVFATTAWEDYAERLYAVVLEQVYRTDDEAARAAIRQRVSARCRSTSSPLGSDMPRIGVRALLKLCLQGKIETSNPELQGAVEALGSEWLAKEIHAANWKSPDRAHRIGEVIAQAKGELLPQAIASALGGSERTATAVIKAASGPLLEPHVEPILKVVDDNETALTALCQVSELAAAETLQRWQRERSIVAFRALASTGHAEERLANIPKVVRRYGKHRAAERAELLMAYGARDDRVEVLCGILRDRSKPAGSSPHADDLINALGLLGEHLAAGLDPKQVVDVIGVVCREATQTGVRKAAYATLGEAAPTADVVDLLIERRGDEATASVQPAVSAALSRLADRLDAQAGDAAYVDRAEAAAQLARIDLDRAVVHARGLLAADKAKDRMVAAGILADSGSQQDAERLEAAVADEPSPDVRREFRRAVRRLRIGGSAAAHERLGELAGVRDPDAWERLNPDELYGGWVDAIVKGLDRVARAGSEGHFDTAIDQLGEIGKALLFRAIEVAGEQIGIKPVNRAKAAANELDYGDALNWQQINESWPWVHNFAALHGLRTEHIAARGSLTPPPDRTPDDLGTAYSFFQLGAQHCCDLLARTVAPGAGG